MRKIVASLVIFLLTLFIGSISNLQLDEYAVIVRIEKRFTSDELKSLLGKEVRFADPRFSSSIGKVTMIRERGRENSLEVTFPEHLNLKNIKLSYDKASFERNLRIIE